MSEITEVDPMQEAQDLAERIGIPIDPAWYIEAQQIGEIAAQNKVKELELAQGNKSQFARIVEAFNRIYPKFLQSLLGAGEILLTFAHTLLIAFILPLALVWAVMVEQGRVFNGAILIDNHTELAQAVAWVLVISNLLVELVIHWDEHRLNWTAPEQYAFSWRIMAEQTAYWLGLNDEWKPVRHSPSFWARQLLKLITITILFLAIGGNMHEVLKLAGDAKWVDALVNIVTKSTLQQMINLIGGVMASVTMVFIVQGLSQYLAKRVIEIVAVMNADNGADRDVLIAKSVVLASASHIVSKLNEQKKLQRRSLATAVDMPMIGVSGKVFVSPDNDLTTKPNEGAESSELQSGQTTGQNEPQKSKLATAVDMLTNDPSLRRLTDRDLEELHPDIGRMTWNAAKKKWHRKS